MYRAIMDTGCSSSHPTVDTQPGGPISSGILGLLLVCFSMPAVAAPEPARESKDAPHVFSLIEEETVSTAIRREQPISQAPSNVYVITAEDIRQSGAPDVPTILRRIPGLDVMQVTGADFNVSVRGNNQLFANKMLVLIDGRSVYIDVQGFIFWKGIEVIKGPVAALYGFNAFDGVVNIITKSPKEMAGTTLQVGGGEVGTISTSAVQAGAEGNFKYRVSGGYEQNHQWRAQDTAAFRSYKFNSQMDYALSGQSKASVSGGLVYMDPHDGPLVGAGSTLLTSGVKLPYANLSYENQGVFLRAYWNGFSRM
ncbi:MAG: TonB-dependent receptor [Nitrospira sp.]|nr:TonB-dependent receptor [Nitrospira sp.]